MLKTLLKTTLLMGAIASFVIFSTPIFLICCVIVLILAILLGYTYEEMNTFLRFNL